MPIYIDEATRTFSLHTDHSTYQMQADPYGCLLHLYYGARTDSYMGYLPTYFDRSGSCCYPHDVGSRSYSLDVLPQEYPFQGAGDLRAPLLAVRDASGAFGCDLRYAGHVVQDGKYALPGLPSTYGDVAVDGAQTLRVTMRDDRLGLEVELLYGVLPRIDVITRAAVIRNGGEGRIVVERAQTACLDFVHGDFDVITFHGRHAMERVPDRRPVCHGVQLVESRRGASSHQYSPFVILADHDATETAGRCWSMSFVYSGDFSARVERAQYDQVRMQMGLSNEFFSYPLEPGDELVAPEVVMTYSNAGLERVSHNMHRCVREHVCRGPWRDRARPVLINSWEATYFDFTGEKLLGLARRAADLGMDMFVMDDGWFGARDNDCCSLGDWRVNEEKLGMPLSELVDRVNEMGLRFGIWMEPEMVNENSDLFRAHPDWALALPGKAPTLGRDQLVLDMARADVRDYLFESMCGVLDQANIDYLKWDFNRNIVDIHSWQASDQGSVLHDYVLGLYELLGRLTSRYPELLIEGCAAGGGRFDLGILAYSPQIWTSDNTDAIDRLTIQYGTSFGFPCSTMGAHVSVSPNEITGRETSLATRGTVAMAGGGFGYELDLTKLTDEECDEVREQIRTYREVERLVREGDYYRLSSPLTDPVAAWESVAADGSEALVSAVVLKCEGYGIAYYVTPRGLTPGAHYRETESGAVYSADALMDMGLPLPFASAPYESHQLRLVRV